MNILENNKKIAAFMGYVEGTLHHTATGGVYPFHNDWNWLMPVVEKIEALDDADTLFCIEGDTCKVWGGEFECVKDEYSKIASVYAACIAFIDWYNADKGNLIT